MNWWRELRRRKQLEHELDAELRFHFDSVVAANVRAGMSEIEARRHARIEFGGMDQVKEECRDARAAPWVETLAQDVRYGLRMMRKSPGLTAILTLTLALGIGANTAVFSVLNGWLLRPLPVPAPEQITVLASQQKDRRNAQFSFAELQDFRRQSDAFSDLFAYGLVIAGLSANGTAGEFAYSAVTGNYFSALGVKPALGRLFLPGEGETPGQAYLGVLGYAYWQKRFGGDRAVIGKQVVVNGKSVTIIGVTPPEFHGTLFSLDMDGYLTMSALARDQDPTGGFWSERDGRHLTMLGRLKPDVGLRQAQGSVDVIAARLVAQYPESEKGTSVRVIPERLARPAPFVASFVPVIASLFMGLPAVVLLLACMNVASILMARTGVRQRELAIRASVGASSGRLIRQMLTESLLLALLGGLGGALVGQWVIRASGSVLYAVTTSTSNYSIRLDPSFDGRVFAFACVVVILTTVFVGIWPALRAARADVNTLLHEGGRGGTVLANRQWTRQLLVAAQVAGSLVLLVVSGLFVRSLGQAQQMNLGFDPDHVLNVMVNTYDAGYDVPRAKGFDREIESRMRALPGVQSVSLANTVPFTYVGDSRPVYAEGNPAIPGQPSLMISCGYIDPSYFDTMHVPLLRGRAFAETDDPAARKVAIVNQALAARLWPNEIPIGKRFRFNDSSGSFVEVVGLVPNGQYMFLSPDPQPYFYLPLAQNFVFNRSLQIRSSAPPETLIQDVQTEIRRLDPNVPVRDIRTMAQLVQGLAGFFLFRLAATLAGVLGLLGMTLAVIGAYGVISFTVSRRTREIGVRTALGAQRGEIMKLVMRQGLRLILTGLLTGAVAAFLLSRVMRKLLIGISPSDPLTYLIAATALCTATLLACWLPARRATRINPSEALRWE